MAAVLSRGDLLISNTTYALGWGILVQAKNCVKIRYHKNQLGSSPSVVKTALEILGR